MPNMNPKQMEKLMKQMGINSKEIEAKLVTIETNEGKIVIESPQVVEINMQGQKSFQISGSSRFEESMNEEDVQLIMEKTKCSREKAVEALKKTNGDIAEAIVILSEVE